MSSDRYSSGKHKNRNRFRLYLFGGGILLVCFLLIFIGLKSTVTKGKLQETEAAKAGKAEKQTEEDETAADYSVLEAEEPLVIVLDPGHDSCHIGAAANGLKEEEVDWKLARKIKEELDTYRDVAVYCTVENCECPWKDLDATEELSARVDLAAKHHADLFVSLHFNYADIKDETGFMIFYPNSNYKPELAQKGEEIAHDIELHLSEAGLEDQGIRSMDSDDNPEYPDHSTADYHGVIRHAKLKGFTGILIEHCFITNIHDVYNYMNTDEGIARLAHADAQGIVDYYHLEKK